MLMRNLLAGLALACTVSFGATLPARAETTLNVAGSTALLPLVKAVALDFQAEHPDISLSVKGGGSRVGITQAAAAYVDLGMSDIPPRRFPSLSDHRVCVTRFVILANPQVGVSNLSSEKIRDIFSGKIKNWKEVGGANLPILVVNRPRTSGTRAVFMKIFMGNSQLLESGPVEDSTSNLVSLVKAERGAIAYAAFGSSLADKNLVSMKINGVTPEAENVETGRYPFWSYEHIVTKGKPSAAAQQFIQAVVADTASIERLGFIAISNMKTSAQNR